METVFANMGNSQATINDVMRQVPCASLRRSPRGYIVSSGGEDAVEIVLYSQAATYVGDPTVMVSCGAPRFLGGLTGASY